MIKRLNHGRRVLFTQLKFGETYYEYYTDSTDKFVGFDGYVAIFEEHIFFAYKKCKFYEINQNQVLNYNIIENDSMNSMNSMNSINLMDQSYSIRNASNYLNSEVNVDADLDLVNQIGKAFGNINLRTLDSQFFF